MPTVIGLIFLLGGLFCLQRKAEWLLGLLILAGLFQAASVFNFGSSGIQPYYFVACLVIISQFGKVKTWHAVQHFHGRNLILAFACLGVFSAIVYPFVFAGTPVYEPSVGIDDGLLYRPPLHFSISNLAQAFYLVVHALVILSVSTMEKSAKIKRAYNMIFISFIALVFVQFICLQIGLSFPYAIFQNNAGYAVADASADKASRIVGTFTEPSGAGLALVSFYAGAFYEFFLGRGSAIRVLITAVGIGLVRSTSALSAMAITTVLICCLHPFYQFPWRIRTARLIKVACIAVVALIVFLSPVASQLQDATTGKTESSSYFNRTAADLFSLQLAASTHWIGVGLGSNRPSSLLASLLSNVGIVGAVLFCVLLFQVGRNVQQEHLWLRWALAGAVIDACFGGPDITQPLIWIYLILIVYYRSDCGVPEEGSLSNVTSLNTRQVS